MLLKMASIRNGLIWDRVHRPKSCDILAKALDEIGIRLEDVDNLVAMLTDPKVLQEEDGVRERQSWQERTTTKAGPLHCDAWRDNAFYIVASFTPLYMFIEICDGIVLCTPHFVSLLKPNLQALLMFLRSCLIKKVQWMGGGPELQNERGRRLGLELVWFTGD